MMEWKPIETAPRDGSRVILLVDDVAISGKWGKYPDCSGGEGGEGWSVDALASHGCGCCAEENDAPTHWQPLPEPPND